MKYLLLLLIPVVAVAGPLEERRNSDRLREELYRRPTTRDFCIQNPDALYPTTVTLDGERLTIIVDCGLWAAWHERQSRE